MKYLSVCSGIEAATVAWHHMGWEPVAFSEIEKFPSQVLAHHYPAVPNWGDMTKFKEWPDADVDVLVGGTPCQSFSVAGLRKGLADPRGNLMLTYLAIAAKYRPEWLVWENVPGVLSSNGGLDFAAFLRGLGEVGYGFAYRVLDAQYFGVPQRRRRVFVVGCLGSWQRAAAVLFERHSLQGHPAPRREKGQRTPGAIGARTCRSIGEQDAECGHLVQWPADVAPTLDTHYGDKQGLENQHINGGGGCSLPELSLCLNAGGMGRQDAESETLIPTRGGRFGETYPINTQIAMRHEALGEGTGMGIGAADDPAFTLQSAHSHAIAFKPGSSADAYSIGAQEEIACTHEGGGGGNNKQAVAFRPQNFGNEGGGYAEAEVSNTLDAIQGSKQRHVAVQSMQVRRLTPVECERLRGFPDDYTLITVRGKPAADGPRYKALGNSMAVPVMAWIGERIAAVEAIAEIEEVAA